MNTKIFVGKEYCSEIFLSEDEIQTKAQQLGDTNPIHHDNTRAQEAGYPSVIASGLHTSSLVVSTLISQLGDLGKTLGLESSFRFRRPVFPDQKLSLVWVVVKISRVTKWKGNYIELTGELRDENRHLLLTATNSFLLLDEV